MDDKLIRTDVSDDNQSAPILWMCSLSKVFDLIINVVTELFDRFSHTSMPEDIAHLASVLIVNILEHRALHSCGGFCAGWCLLLLLQLNFSRLLGLCGINLHCV